MSHRSSSHIPNSPPPPPHPPPPPLPLPPPLLVQVPEYFAVIEKPITVLSLLEDLEGWLPGEVGSGSGLEGIGDARSVELVDGFAISVRRMWENCWSYNHEGTKVYPSVCRGAGRSIVRAIEAALW